MREKILACLSNTKATSYDDVLKQFDAKDHYLVELHLASLIDHDMVSMKEDAKSRTFLLTQKSPRQNLKQEKLEQEKESQETENKLQYQIAATLPENILSMKSDTLTTRKALRDLLSSAKNEILVSQPFLDNIFVDIYEDELRQLAKKGTRFVLLTRKVSTDTITVKGILKIFEMYAMHSHGSKFEVYEHWIPLRIDNESSKQFVGLHAKLVMTEDQAYLGSANWTGYSLSNNVELGLLMRDKTIIHQLKDLFFFVMAQSTRIDMEKIHQKLTSKIDEPNGK